MNEEQKKDEIQSSQLPLSTATSVPLCAHRDAAAANEKTRNVRQWHALMAGHHRRHAVLMRRGQNKKNSRQPPARTEAPTKMQIQRNYEPRPCTLLGAAKT